jgi:hypothetical protein
MLAFFRRIIGSGAATSAIPPGVLGGATIVLYGLVGVLGIRIWLINGVDFGKPLNQMTAATPLIIGIAGFTWQLGDLTFTGIALGSLTARRGTPIRWRCVDRPPCLDPTTVTATRRRAGHPHRTQRRRRCRTRPTPMGRLRCSTA